MPPRHFPRAPFAGIGAGHSIVASLSREPASPIRPQHHTSTSATNSPRRFDGLPAVGASSNTFAGFSDSDFSSSGVSDSLSRAFYVDVILEQASSSGSSVSLSKSVSASAFSTWLGDQVPDYDADTSVSLGSSDDSQSVPRSASGSSITAVSSSAASSGSSAALTTPHGAKPTKINPSRLFGRVQELIDTERSYVKRINVLHRDYADPLRALAKNRKTAILPPYEAQKLFGNIGEIAGANQAFLNDLEHLASQGQEVLRAGLGDVLYNHMSCFSCYSEYFANFERAKHIEQTYAKHRVFSEFTDSVKYSVTGIGNTGLRDLLMEPIQRIPRYKLLIDAILNHVEPRDPLRRRLQQVISLVSRIASCEADDKTTRAAILASFTRNVESFPAELISAHRRFIDCIDVDDYPVEASAATSGIGASFSGLKPLRCTLFLFDDRIAIVKRASATSSGRKIIGLDDVNRLTSQMKSFADKSALAATKRSELAFRGSIGLMDLEAEDLGGADLQLAFLRAPSHVISDKWTNRPLRKYMAVDTSAASPSLHASRSQPGSSILDAETSAKLEKMRFLESIWKAKALYKARRSHCETRCLVVPASRRRVDSNDDMLGAIAQRASLQDARKVIYFHVHSPQSYANELYRTPVAISVDETGTHRRTPLGASEAAYPHASLDISDVDEMEEVFVAQERTKAEHGADVYGEALDLSSSDLGEHIAQLSDQVDRIFGSVTRALVMSQPGTPSGSGFKQRAKAAAGLEFGRNLLFGGSGTNSSISSAGISNLDVFGSPARRSNSNASKSTFSSNAASVSSRGMTHSTAGTSISSRSRAYETLTRDSPGSFRRFGRRRSSSVGPPSSVGCVSADEDESRNMRRARAATPEPVSLLSTSAGAASPRKLGAGNGTIVGGRTIGGHVRARTESAAPSTPTSWSPTKAQPPYQQRQRAESVELTRTPSSAGRRPTGPREQTSPSPSPAPRSRIDVASPSWLSSGPTTPLNIRRKPAPHAGQDSDNEGGETPVRARPASSLGVYSAAEVEKKIPAGGVGQRRISGTKRPLSYADADVQETEKERALNKRPSLGRETISTLPRAVRLSVEESAQRPSISESETSTERGHGHDTGSKPVAETIPTIKAPVTPARTSSTATKSAEARRRNEALEHGLRLVKEELNLLRCDVEILQSSLAAAEHDPRVTPRKAGGPLKELDINTAAHTSATIAEVDNIHARIKKLEFLYGDVDAKWISVMRMHNRIVHDYSILSSATATPAPAPAPAQAQADAELVKEKAALEVQLSALKRKCDLLTTLEADGRLENTEIHKAFNEELDALYDNTQKPESEELEELRRELKRARARETELEVENKRLKRDLEVERCQTEAFAEVLGKKALA